nr:MAG TPA: hypothetical protein [Caudoviricetes sp.]
MPPTTLVVLLLYRGYIYCYNNNIIYNYYGKFEQSRNFRHNGG